MRSKNTKIKYFFSLFSSVSLKKYYPLIKMLSSHDQLHYVVDDITVSKRFAKVDNAICRLLAWDSDCIDFFQYCMYPAAQGRSYFL